MNCGVLWLLGVSYLFFCSFANSLEAPPQSDLSEKELLILNQAFTKKKSVVLELLTSANIKSDELSYINRLILSNSPYLLRHSVNPINWKEWEQLTLENAKFENKLIFLSIGYSTCHWCHVMEKDSFVDLEVAKLLNQYFVSIKVDRELNTIIDQKYSNYLTALKGSSGWPLTAILTPDGQPIWMDVFVDKPRLIKTLSTLHSRWSKQPQLIKQIAKNITLSIEQVGYVTTKNWSSTLLDTQIEKWVSFLDKQYGGVKGSPKFPEASLLSLLLLEYHHSNNLELKLSLISWLDSMYKNPIRDQVMGGFHRYSSDEYWQEPHFEKMLYSQAQLVSVYSLAARILNKPEYYNVALDTLKFTERFLSDDNVAFYAALDADHFGDEGRFYTFITKQYKSQSVLNDFQWIQINNQWLPEFIQVDNSEARSLLSNIRLTKPLPHVDKKIMTGWNALMISSYLSMFEYSGAAVFLEKSELLAGYIKNNHDVDGYLIKAIYLEQAVGKADSSDYASYIQALLKLYKNTNKRTYLSDARRLAKQAFRLYEQLILSGSLKDSETASAISTLYSIFSELQTLQFTPVKERKILQKVIQEKYVNDPGRSFEATRALKKYSVSSAFESFAMGSGSVKLSCETTNDFNVEFNLESPWHINSHQQRIKSLVALSISSLSSNFKVEYPVGVEKKLSFDKQKLSLLENNFKAKVSGLTFNKEVVVSLQACNETTCLLPEKLLLNAPLNCFKAKAF